jgi:hypothetical protein
MIEEEEVEEEENIYDVAEYRQGKVRRWYSPRQGELR